MNGRFGEGYVTPQAKTNHRTNLVRKSRGENRIECKTD